MGKQKKYYAVQIGENYDYDFDGSTVKREAFRIARRYARNPAYAGKAVRVVDIDVDDNGCMEYCNAEYIVSDGTLCDKIPKYKAVVSSDSFSPREYAVTSKSAMKAAQEYGRCEGGEVVRVVTIRSGRVLSEVRWTPEDGGHYYRCEV